ncbi:MAG TPA: hypothetical protein VFS00_25895 [Polyangiaceae bacterium]|nr:hypothetical protein [Polyangiaceae bacterium]
MAENLAAPPPGAPPGAADAAAPGGAAVKLRLPGRAALGLLVSRKLAFAWAAALVALAGGLAFATTLDDPWPPGAALAALLAAVWSVRYVPTALAAGPEGVSARWLFVRRAWAFDTMFDLARFGDGQGDEGVTVQTRDGRVLTFRTTVRARGPLGRRPVAWSSAANADALEALLTKGVAEAERRHGYRPWVGAKLGEAARRSMASINLEERPNPSPK